MYNRMMKIFESGRESSLLADMKAGTKTVEVRLARGKFLGYTPGDHVLIREDYYEGSQIIKSLHNQLKVEVQKVEKYSSFKKLFEKVDYKLVVPRAKSLEEALEKPRMFYSHEDEEKYGVLAIYFKVIN